MKKNLLVAAAVLCAQLAFSQSVPVRVDSVWGSGPTYFARLKSVELTGLPGATAVAVGDSVYIQSETTLAIRRVDSVFAASGNTCSIRHSGGAVLPARQYGAVVAPGEWYTYAAEMPVDAAAVLDKWFHARLPAGKTLSSSGRLFDIGRGPIDTTSIYGGRRLHFEPAESGYRDWHSHLDLGYQGVLRLAAWDETAGRPFTGGVFNGAHGAWLNLAGEDNSLSLLARDPAESVPNNLVVSGGQILAETFNTSQINLRAANGGLELSILPEDGQMWMRADQNNEGDLIGMAWAGYGHALLYAHDTGKTNEMDVAPDSTHTRKPVQYLGTTGMLNTRSLVPKWYVDAKTWGLNRLEQSGATAGQLIKWTGAAWEPGDVEGSTPGGSSRYVQFNNGEGGFGGSDLFQAVDVSGSMKLVLNSAAETIISTSPEIMLGAGTGMKVRYGKSGSDNLAVQYATNELRHLIPASGSHYFTWGSDNAGAYTERMRLTAGGNLGIGTNNPLYRLDGNSGVLRWSSSGTPTLPNTASTACFQNNSSGFTYLEVKNASTTALFFGAVSSGGAGRIGWHGTGGLNFNSAPALNPSTVYDRFFIHDDGEQPRAWVGGGTAAAGTPTWLTGGMMSATASATATNTTSETAVLGTVSGTKTLPANLFRVGKRVIVRVSGTIDTDDTTPGTLNVRLKFGSTTIAETTANTLTAIAGSTARRWTATFEVTCRSTGASGTLQAGGEFFYYTDATTRVAWQCAENLVSSFNTTTTHAVDVTATWSIADTDNIIIGTQCVLTIED